MSTRPTAHPDASYRGWARPGPVPPGADDAARAHVDEGQSLDWLCGHWKIFQYVKGHRYSSDDVVCAWYASTWAPRVDRYCDLGSGIGSVANIVAWRLPGARVVTVEAQDISLALANKTARYNGLDARATLLHGDLRDPAVLDEAVRVAGGGFDLVTGSPPYWPVGSALASAHAQAVPARLEVRGDVGDYAKSAARILAPGGVFACVFQASQHERVQRAIADAGLVLLRSRHVVFKEGDASGVVVYVAAHDRDVPHTFPRGGEGAARVEGKPVVEPPLIIRRADGSTHPEYATVRLSFGFPPGDVAP
jgi:tRNA1Val (adenine37-N6)-methyltransferase